MKPLDVALPHNTSSGAQFSKTFMYALHDLHFLVEKRLSIALEEKKALSFSQFIILVGFNCSLTGEVSQTRIAEHLHLTEATVSRHISNLVSTNYLSRKEDTGNRRKHTITITKKGQLAFKDAEQIINKELKEIFSTVESETIKSMIHTINLVTSHLLTKK